MGNLFTFYYKDMIEQSNRQNRVSLRFEKKIGIYFIAPFELHGHRYYSQKLSSLTNAKFITSRRTDMTLQISVKQLRAKTMCSTFKPYCRLEKSFINLFENLFCADILCSRKFHVHKRTFQPLGRSDYQSRQCLSTCRIR